MIEYSRFTDTNTTFTKSGRAMVNIHLEKAKSLIKNTDAVFAYISDEDEIISDKKGIGFVTSLCNGNKDLSKGAAADKIVGKAAAMLFVLLGLKHVYAETLSEGAASIFERYGIEYGFGTKTDAIVNRKGDGLCPMENAVKDIDSPEEALKAINETLERLKSNNRI